MQDLDSLALGRVDCHTDADIHYWQPAFDLVMAEIHRLGEYPSLIADEETRENFFQYVQSFCSFIQFRPTDVVRPAGEAVARSLDEADQKAHRGSYTAGRVPWHQFLHHCSPGSNSAAANCRTARDAGTRQIIPPGGIRLLREWEKDFEQYTKEEFPVREAIDYCTRC